MAETEETLETLEGPFIQDMEVVVVVEAQAGDTSADNGAGAGGLKRARDEADEEGENNEDAKKQKADKSVEEERLEKTTEEEKEEDKKSGSDADADADAEPKSVPVKLGPKSFGSSVEMFDYFYKFLHFWTPNVNVNKYEHVMLLELLNKGHLEPDKKIGSGIRAFQVRYHPKFRSRCFFLLREDDSVDDFSFRKCVDHILPLPENMQVKHDVNKALGGARGGKAGGGGGRGGRGYGRGRGGKSRN